MNSSPPTMPRPEEPAEKKPRPDPVYRVYLADGPEGKELSLVGTVRAPDANAARWVAVDADEELSSQVAAGDTLLLVAILERRCRPIETTEQVVQKRVRR